jgi:hypothetical protein
MKTATLAAILERDLLRTEPAKTETPTCFACGRPMIHRPREGDDSSRFCSPRCEEAHYVAGLPPYEVIAEEFKRLSRLPFTANSNLRVVAGPPGVTSPYNPLQGSRQLSRGIKRRGPEGWIIQCFGCGNEFDSKGLRCCSAECERRYREHRENEQLMAEAGMDRFVKRKCKAAGCGRDIPAWRNGRRVSKATRFCSDRCQQRHARALKNIDRVSEDSRDVFPAETAKKIA